MLPSVISVSRQNRPCKIVEMSTSKTGKHGHAKVHMVALDIFTGLSSSAREVPWI
jgi:translation elongation factor P/translation initiation factor 5A